MTDNLFDLVFRNWTRPVKESRGYKIIDKNDSYLIVANTLGIREEDLNISLDGNTLNIQGKTELKDIDFYNTVSYKFDLATVPFEIKSIDYYTINGLTYIYLYTEQKRNKEIPINKINY
ncbi:MAG: Hsp20/alpha crystallin family protein [Halanaerobiales bacterium]